MRPCYLKSILEAGIADDPQVGEIIAFIRAGGDRGLCTPRDNKDSGA
jgi:hypothetical protein